MGPGTYSGPGEVPIVFPFARSLKIVSEQGPFVTELVGNSSASGSVVVMDVGNDFDSVTIDGFTIRDNTVFVPVCDYCAGGITVGLITKANILNCIISGNTGIGNDLVGGIAYKGIGGTVANNWIIGNSGGNAPSSVGGVFIYSGANVTFVNNTIVGNRSPDSSAAGVLIIDGTAVSRLDNNIFAYNSPGSGLRSISPVTKQSFNNNLYFGNAASTAGISFFDGWVFSDPVFKSRDSADYHLTCPSPARNAGLLPSVPSGLTHDIDGQLRTTSGLQVDIGADQFYDADKQAIFTPSVDSGCAPLTVSFTNQSLCIDEEWEWNFGDGGTSTVKNPTHQFANPGIYFVRLIARGVLDADTTFDTIAVHAPIIADFSANATNGCVPFQVTFTASANADASVDLYTWEFGDGQLGAGSPVTHTYTIPATHTVRLHATNTCDTVTTTKNDYITAATLPVVDFTSSFDTVVGAPCNPFTVQFRYTSDRPILAWSWDFGDNQTSTDSMPLHVFAEGDTFSVLLIATNECGEVRVVRSNYIKLTPRPTVSASAGPAVACEALTQVAFSGAVTGNYTSAFWVFGDGATAPGLSTTHIYTQVGRYLPKLVVISACGQDSIPIADSITVGSIPEATFSVDADSGYEPLNVQFTDETSSLPTAWLWRFGDNGTSTLQSPAHVYTTGVHQASLVASSPCGTDTSANRRIVVGSFRPLIVDSIGTSGDTILYSIQIDSLVIGYDHTVHLTGRMTPLPIQGSMNFVFAPASGVPPFTSIMKAIPSLDLSSGNYAIELRAVDSTRLDQQGQPVTKTAARPYTHVGFSSLQLTPSPIVMESTIVTFLTTRTVTIRNTSTGQQGFTLVVQPAQISGPPFEILPNQGNGATLTPGQALVWNLGFRPTRKGGFTGWVRVRSNDPANPELQVTMTGRGIGEQVPPRVTVASPVQNAEATIDQNVALTFSELMAMVPLDTVFEVKSKRANAPIPGVAQMTPLTLTFAPSNWFWPDDTITVTLRAIVTDTNGNRLDGDGDEIESGSPTDDFRLTFRTGPGVFPGDANHDGVVNEVDILPLGRFWRLQGPPRSRPYTSFTVQPSRGFPTRVAAHADCDGNGIIDSADICPIAEFFERDTVLPKAVVQAWLAEADGWSASVVDALLGALAACPAQGQGNTILREILSEAESQNPVPADYALDQNYPNPFNPATVIAFSLTQSGEVDLDVFDILGRRVTTLAEGHWEAGRHRVVWDGRDADGRELATGIYFYRLRTDHFVQTRKMLLLK